MIALLFALVTSAFAAPPVFTHQGRLTDALGQPIDGTVTFDFLLYTSEGAAEGTDVWSAQRTVDVTGGYYSVELGDSALEAQLRNEELWMEIQAGGVTLGGRQRLGAVPYAAMAFNAGDGAPSVAPASCEAILDNDATAASGTYWIDPDGTGAYEVWCEMGIASGGWELAMNLDTGDGQVRGWTDRGFWEGGAATGNVDRPFATDFKSMDVFQTAHEDLLIVVHRGGTTVGYAAWNLEHARSLQQFLNTEPSRNPIRLATTIIASDVAAIESTEVVVRPLGPLAVNEIWGNATFDVARIRSQAIADNDNQLWGLGMTMDAQNNGGSVSHPMSGTYPSCDAGGSLPWDQYICIGTDRECTICNGLFGGTRGLAYDYAIYVRTPVPEASIAPTSLGGSAATAADDCEAILAADASTPDGTYWVDFGTGTQTQAVCDMTTAGGGWTLMMNLDTSDGTPRYYRDDAFWTGTGSYGNPAEALTSDYKDAGAFARDGAFTELLVTVHQEGVTTNGYRAWNLSGTSSFEMRFASASSRSPAQLTTSSIANEVSSLWANESIVLPNNNLFVNRVWGDGTSFDVSRIHNLGAGVTNNEDWGLGVQMDAQNNGGTEASPGLPSYPGCDAGSITPWSNHFCMGSDVDADNGRYGTTTGYGFDINYDYAIWVR